MTRQRDPMEPSTANPAPPSPTEEFGRFLARERELRGITLKHVAEVTRISEDYLRALEEGRHDRLPGRVFIVGYVRAYAKCVGLSQDDAVLRFQELSGPSGDSGKTNTVANVRRYRVVAFAVATLLLVGGLVWLFRTRA